MEMEKRSVRGLSLRGSMCALGRGRQHPKKLSVEPVARASSAFSGPESDCVAGSARIASADVLMRELRKSIHAMFCSVDPNIATKNLYDNYSQQAFRFFTTTNTITPEAFHHKVVKIGLSVSLPLCLELFGRIDQENLGEINYATFARRIFLPPGHSNFDPAPFETEANELQPSPPRSIGKPHERSTSDLTQGTKMARPTSASRLLWPTGSRASDAGHHITEFEDEEIIEEDAVDGAVSSMDLMHAKRRERRRFQEKKARKAHQELEDESRASRSTSKYAESVAASSTLSAASSGSKAPGTAKYTPQRTHTLLIRRFIQTTKRGGHANSATASPTTKGSNSCSKRR